LGDDASEAEVPVPFFPVAEKEDVDAPQDVDVHSIPFLASEAEIPVPFFPVAEKEYVDALCDVDVHRISFLVWVAPLDVPSEHLRISWFNTSFL
jgi:hypothetical protein